ncbi:hypothetical protein [Harryflintia acetispora]|uniref:Phage tail protein n=1 Tax=Harryflintia acetispora TaxID=1849041 RepID=A0A9X8UJR6_9FIRM|nr:hypothetical protein [Harryflintia acetispora]TCL43222.1 hypothetical protein EDD78_10682 [Harryflintia acetispora]
MLKVNGKSYDWGDVDVRIPGLNLQATEVSYDDELEKESVYGFGRRPRGYGTGNYKSEGKLTMLRDDFDEVLDYCKRSGKGIYDLIFPKMTVSYANDGDRTRTDVLNSVTITKTSNKASQGDKSLAVELDLLIIHGIDRDGVKPISGR